jgi:hypothetical protein
MPYSINDFKNKITTGVRPNLFSISIPNITGDIDNANPDTGGGLSKLKVFSSNADESITLLCKSAALPSSSQGVAEVPFRGRVLKLPGDRTYDAWTATFYNDADFSIRSLFEGWINLINKGDANIGQLNPINIFRNIEVNQLKKSINNSPNTPTPLGVTPTSTTSTTPTNSDILRSYILNGAFPTSVSAITLGFDQNDQIEEFDVEFQYQYFSIIDPNSDTKNIY